MEHPLHGARLPDQGQRPEGGAEGEELLCAGEAGPRHGLLPERPGNGESGRAASAKNIYIKALRFVRTEPVSVRPSVSELTNAMTRKPLSQQLAVEAAAGKYQRVSFCPGMSFLRWWGRLSSSSSSSSWHLHLPLVPLPLLLVLLLLPRQPTDTS